MSFLAYKESVFDEIEEVLSRIDDEEFAEFVRQCKNARRIMLIGKGRVGLCLKAFSMKLNSIGKESCVLDETTAFHMTGEDLLILGNMTGEAGWADYYIDLARAIGAPVLYITSLDGRASKCADAVLHIRARAYGVSDDENYSSCQPMSSTAEQCLWFALDAAAQLVDAPRETDDPGQLFRCIMQEIRKSVLAVDETETERLIAEIENSKAKCFFVSGRSGFVLKIFAMRLYHMGYTVRICDETGWRTPGEGDILIVCDDPASHFPTLTVQEACRAGCTVFAVTRQRIPAVECAFSLCIPGEEGSASGNLLQNPQAESFSEESFQRSLYVTLDYIVYKMMVLHNQAESDLAKRHTNIP